MPDLKREVRALQMEQSFRRSCEALLEAWETRSEVEARRNVGDIARVLYGLAHVVVTSSQASFILADRGGPTDALILSRRAFEFGVTGQWIHQRGEAGLRALEAETERLLKTTVVNMTKAGWEVPDDIAESVSHVLVAPPEASTFRNFDQICRSFEGGDHLYVVYRHLSAWCHPNITTGYQLFDALDTTGRAEQERLSNSELARTVAYTNLMALLLGMRAADERTLHKPLKRSIQTVARRHKLPSMLRAAG